jgi:hypothetical protein
MNPISKTVLICFFLWQAESNLEGLLQMEKFDTKVYVWVGELGATISIH